MSKEDTKDLAEFMKPFDDHIVELAVSLREFIWDLFPECSELIYDNYNAVAVGGSPTLKLGDTFCSIGVFNNVNGGTVVKSISRKNEEASEEVSG